MAGTASGQRQPPGTVAAAFGVKRITVPWDRVGGIALTSTLAGLVGVAAGQTVWGVWAFLGGLASFYATGQPYPRRARVLAVVALGLAAAMAAGSLSVNWPLALVVLAGVSTVATFVCGKWRIPLPAGFMFVLVACIAAAKPEPAKTPLEVVVALAGGGIAWIVGMGGWLARPHAPEAETLRKAYRAIADYLGRMGGDGALAAQNEAARAVAEAVAACEAGSRRDLSLAQCLRSRARRAEDVLLAAVALSTEIPQPPAPQWRSFVERLGTLSPPPPAPPAPGSGPLAAAFRRAAERAARSGSERTATAVGRAEAAATPRLSPSPLIPYTSLRIGIAVAVAVLVAHALGVAHPVWLPLTAAAVLQGETVRVFTRRAVQRVIGTVLGLLLAAGLILGLHAGPLASFALVVVLQALMVIFIAGSYGIAVGFMTAFALLILHLTSHAPEAAVLVARLRDTLLGAVVATAAAYLLWPRVSSRRLRPAVAQVCGRAQALLRLLTQGGRDRQRTAPARAHLQSALLHADAVARDAWDEVPPSRTARLLAPSLAAAQRLGYLLMAADVTGQGLRASDTSVAEADEVLRYWTAPTAGGGAAGQPGLEGVWQPVARELRALAQLPEARQRG